jgi:glycosyltransferase involved in cell wall biosynthesis
MDSKKSISICAVIAVKNEAHYLRFLLPILAEQNIDVVIIDNGSDTECSELYLRYQRKPIISVIDVPYTGTFSLTQQLETKRKVYANSSHDWLIHHDADEILQHKNEGLTLRNAIEEADERGYTVLNFEEFVFLPEPEKDYMNRNYYTEMLRYYFFAPDINRLNRAWKRKTLLSNIHSGGHRLEGPQMNISPENHILRHYIVLSQSHAFKKYLSRKFDNADLNKGWHGNRLSFTPENLILPAAGRHLFTLENIVSKDFDRDNPTKLHFWQWEKQ